MRQAVMPNLNRLPTASTKCEQLLTLQPAPERPIAVLDTNAALDWLLFAEPSIAALSAAIVRQQVRWLATTAMRGEFAHVLSSGLAAARGADVAAALAHWDALVQRCDTAAPMSRAVGLVCSDPDDQMFLDLAHGTGARWLISRDRAVLRLGRRAARFGMTITTPQGWSAPA